MIRGSFFVREESKPLFYTLQYDALCEIRKTGLPHNVADLFYDTIVRLPGGYSFAQCW